MSAQGLTGGSVLGLASPVSPKASRLASPPPPYQPDYIREEDPTEEEMEAEENEEPSPKHSGAQEKRSLLAGPGPLLAGEHFDELTPKATRRTPRGEATAQSATAVSMAENPLEAARDEWRQRTTEWREAVYFLLAHASTPLLLFDLLALHVAFHASLLSVVLLLAHIELRLVLILFFCYIAVRTVCYVVPLFALRAIDVSNLAELSEQTRLPSLIAANGVWDAHRFFLLRPKFLLWRRYFVGLVLGPLAGLALVLLTSRFHIRIAVQAHRASVWARWHSLFSDFNPYDKSMLEVQFWWWVETVQAGGGWTYLAFLLLSLYALAILLYISFSLQTKPSLLVLFKERGGLLASYAWDGAWRFVRPPEASGAERAFFALADLFLTLVQWTLRVGAVGGADGRREAIGLYHRSLPMGPRKFQHSSAATMPSNRLTRHVPWRLGEAWAWARRALRRPTGRGNLVSRLPSGPPSVSGTPSRNVYLPVTGGADPAYPLALPAALPTALPTDLAGILASMDTFPLELGGGGLQPAVVAPPLAVDLAAGPTILPFALPPSSSPPPAYDWQFEGVENDGTTEENAGVAIGEVGVRVVAMELITDALIALPSTPLRYLTGWHKLRAHLTGAARHLWRWVWPTEERASLVVHLDGSAIAVLALHGPLPSKPTKALPPTLPAEQEYESWVDRWATPAGKEQEKDKATENAPPSETTKASPAPLTASPGSRPPPPSTPPQSVSPGFGASPARSSSSPSALSVAGGKFRRAKSALPCWARWLLDSLDYSSSSIRRSDLLLAQILREIKYSIAQVEARHSMGRVTTIPPDELLHLQPLSAATNGGQAEVYRAFWRGEQVAVKAVVNLPGEEAKTVSLEQALLGEALVLGHFPSRYILALRGSCIATQDSAAQLVGQRLMRSYLVMEWMNHGSLKTLLDSPTFLLPTHRLVRLLYQAARGVEALHAGWDGGLFSILHGDLKPHNMLVTCPCEGGCDCVDSPTSLLDLRIGDFGSSLVLQRLTDDKVHICPAAVFGTSDREASSGALPASSSPPPSSSSPTPSRLNSAIPSLTEAVQHYQQIGGTPRYMAPELLRAEIARRGLNARGRPVLRAADSTESVQASDVYSFALVMWECLQKHLGVEESTQRRAFVAETRHIPHSDPDAYIQALFDLVEVNLFRPSVPVVHSKELVKLNRLIRRCWHPVPSQRPTFSSIVHKLAQLQKMIK